MKKARTFMPTTKAAVALLGAQVALARKERRWTAADLAERVGVTAHTIGRLERGEPTVAIGVVLEAAVVTGVPLFAAPESDLPGLAAAARQRLAVLPARVSKADVVIDDDF